MEDGRPLLPPSRLRVGSGVGTVDGIRRPTIRAQQLRREATPAERRLWLVINAGKLGVTFSRQMPVGPYICDFLCRTALLAIELDGDSHVATVDHDRRRDAFIRSRGIRTLRFSNRDVFHHLEGVVNAIREAFVDSPNPSRRREGS